MSVPSTPEKAKQGIQKLVEKYQALSTPQIKGYHEATTKQGFIVPFFRALGWDFDDTNEVAPEESTSRGRVDYAFKLHGVSQFYLEAKPLRDDLASDPEWVTQALTYAYNKGVTWALLTNFKELWGFVAQDGRCFLNLTYKDYETNFERLWLLSPQSFEKKALDEEAVKSGALPKRVAIETRLFDNLRRWRGELFTQLHRYNPQLTFSQVDEVIQRLFNRLIFIRTCEDRGLEEKVLRSMVNQWKSVGRKGHLIESLREVFRQFDGYYDSDLFVLHICDQVFVENETLEHIIDGLYEIPGSPARYDFSVIDADVLGRVYEQYLGYVAKEVRQAQAQVQARMELGIPGQATFEVEATKPKRKEHGIYYTPKWVVDYIVRETVGRYIQEHNYHEILNMRILDPACGSGSFLIRAYDELLNYHAHQREKTAGQLDQWDRLPILTGNIFGVDLDTQAVEISRLNLLLRSLARRETLPSLADNIRRGNSLIWGADEELRQCFGDNFRDKKAFNWQEKFPDIIKQGGFDVVIGNPPYVRIQSLPRDEADYYRGHFQAASGSFDIYVLFLERGIRLLKPGGRLGFICSSKFLKSQYGDKILQVIRRECAVEKIVDLSAQTVFAEATTYPALVVLRKGPGDDPLRYISAPQGVTDSAATSAVEIEGLPTVLTDQGALARRLWPPLATNDTLWAKLTANTEPLGKLARKVFVGLQTSADRVYILEKRGEVKKGLVPVYSRATGQQHTLEAELLKPLLSGQDIERYGTPTPKNLLLFPYKVSKGKAELIASQEFSATYQNCWQYLLQNRSTLEDRERGKMRHERWYAFGRTQNLALHDLRKLAIPRLVKHIKAVYDGSGSFYLDNVDVGGVILKVASQQNCLYMLGLLHSRLLDFCFRRISAPFRGDFRSANRQFIEPLPIRRIAFSNPAEKKMHDALVALVDKMLALHRKLAELKAEGKDILGEEKREVESEIKNTDQAIDQLVYQLYGITEAEKQTIEASLVDK